MTTFARIVQGFAIDCRVHATATELAACFHPEWLAAHPFVVVPDGTQHGAKDNGNGTFTNILPPQPDPPVPINVGNPYFGKRPLETKDFWALIGTELPASRLKRLVTDSHFIWVQKVIDQIVIVDVDDKGGQFLKIAAYLINTSGDDASPLLKQAELDAIMGAWP